MITEEYAPGRLVDVHGDGDGAAVLMWHGRGPDDRTSLTWLAESVAEHDLRVLTADWNSFADDGGRADLLASLRHAREHAATHDIDVARLVIVGWSLGGTAAVGLAVHGKRLGLPPMPTVLLAPGDGERALDAISGLPLPATFPPAVGRAGLDVLYGTRDDIADAGLVRGLAGRLEAADWDVRVTEVDADHETIVESPLAASAIVAAATFPSS
jgi:dienelactone hydrolase